jgi:hypothetical protein
MALCVTIFIGDASVGGFVDVVIGDETWLDATASPWEAIVLAFVAAHTETRNVLSWQKISIFGNIEARNLLFSFCARQTPNGLSVCHIILKKELFGQRFPKMSGNK